MSEFLDPNTRRRIIDILIKNPGLSTAQLAKILSISPSKAEKYLIFLQNNGEVLSLPYRGESSYYVRKRRRGSREKRTQEVRSKITDLLLEHPGMNMSAIAEKLDMSPQLAEYHLLNMERQYLIIGVKEEGEYYRRFYVKESEVGVRDKKILAILRQEHLLRIVLLIMKYPNVNHKDLSEHLNITPGTLTHHLIRLEECDLLDVVTSGREKEYKIKQTNEIIQLIRKYIFDIITERFHDIWDDLYIK